MPNKQDSNVSGLRYAEEASLGALPVTPTWVPLEPNSYSDFGGSITTVARSPINSGRQRKKGVTTDLDASGGFNQDLTQTNLRDLLQGFFFADLRMKGEEEVTAVATDTSNPDEYQVASTAGFVVGSLIKGSGFADDANNGVHPVTAVTANTSVEVADGTLVDEASPPAGAKITVVGFRGTAGDIDVDASGARPALTSTAVDFTTLGLIPGEWIFVGGDSAGTQFATAANNGFARIRSVAANRVEFDKTQSVWVTEANTTSTIELYFGHVLKNEALRADQVRRSYHLERTLGDDGVGEQAEYLKGAVPNQVTFNINQADKVTVDLTFIAIDNEQVDGTSGLKTGNRPSIVESDAFNTSSDFSRLKMNLVTTSPTQAALFAFLTEMTLTINNNLSVNKAVSVLGGFDVTAGDFVASGSATAYFGDVAATKAVRDNEDVTLDFGLVKQNAGIYVDVPMIALGDGRLNVTANQPITLPLNMEAATGAKVHPDLDHTALMVFFDYLPDAAG